MAWYKYNVQQDYVIIKQNTTIQIQDTRAYRGIICGSEHCTYDQIKGNLSVHTQKNRKANKWTTRTRKFFDEKLQLGENTRTLYQKRLAGN